MNEADEKWLDGILGGFEVNPLYTEWKRQSLTGATNMIWENFKDAHYLFQAFPEAVNRI